MKTFLPLFIFFSCLLHTGCTLPTVDYDYDRDFDFSDLKQYSWLDIPADFPANEIVVQRIKRAVNEQMDMKGFVRSTEAPDFLISLQGFRDIVREGVERGTTYGTYRGYRGYDRGYQRRVDVYEYEEGTLTLTIVSTKNNSLIWQGSATTTIEPNLSVETKEKRTREIVAKLLSDFPPSSKK
jgi:hypothetical protein